MANKSDGRDSSEDATNPEVIEPDEGKSGRVTPVRSGASMTAATGLSSGVSPAVEAAMKSLQPSALLVEAMRGVQPSALLVEAMRGVQPSALLVEAMRGVQPSAITVEALKGVQGQPALKDWTEALGRTLGPATSRKVRRRHEAVEFFAAFEGEVSSLAELLRALAVMQEKQPLRTCLEGTAARRLGRG
jgi:hypothetical protein